MSNYQLNESHTQQLNAVMKYFKSRRESFEEVELNRDCINFELNAPLNASNSTYRVINFDQVSQVFSEMKSVKLNEEMYNREEVENILDECSADVQSCTTGEMERMVLQMGAFVRELYLQAEGNGVTLTVDSKIIQNEKLAQSMKNTSFFPTKKKGLVALTNTKIDGSLVGKVNRLESDKKSLEAELQKKNLQLQEALKAHSDASSSESKLKFQLDISKKELVDMKSSLEGKLNMSKPFLNMKSMLTKKNAQLKAARAELAKFQDNSSSAITIED